MYEEDITAQSPLKPKLRQWGGKFHLKTEFNYGYSVKFFLQMEAEDSGHFV